MALVGSSGRGFGSTPRGIPKSTALFKPVAPRAGGGFGAAGGVPALKPPKPAANAGWGHQAWGLGLAPTPKPNRVQPNHITNTPVQVPGGVPGAGAPTQAPQAGPGGTPGSSSTQEPSPYDSTYYIDLARATAAANARINGYQTRIGNEQLATNNAIQQLQYNQGLSTRNAQNAENSRGGFAQGALGDTIGRIGKASLDAQSANALRFQQDSQNWQTAITNARQGLSTEQIALALASGARQARLNAGSNGTIGDVTSSTPGTPAAAGPAAPAAAAPAAGLSRAPAGQQRNQAAEAEALAAAQKARALATQPRRNSAPAAAWGRRPNWGF